MNKEECNGKCCTDFFDDYDEDSDDYEIQRLKDIIKICEFLIKTKEHSKHKKEDLEDFLREATKEEKTKRVSAQRPVYIYGYKPFDFWRPWF